MSDTSRSSSSKDTVTTSTVDESLLDEETEESELDEEERAHVMEKAAACKFAIEQFYDGFWRYRSQREARYEHIGIITCSVHLVVGLLESVGDLVDHKVQFPFVSRNLPCTRPLRCLLQSTIIGLPSL